MIITCEVCGLLFNNQTRDKCICKENPISGEGFLQMLRYDAKTDERKAKGTFKKKVNQRRNFRGLTY